MTDAALSDEATFLEGVVLPDDATVQQRLVAILAELPAIGKESWNEQQRFHYRSHDDVLNALNPLLAKHGVVVTPFVMKRVQGERTTAKGSTMYEVNLHVQYTFHGLAGDSIEASAWGEGTDMGDKATNKAMTGAFKACLAQVFAISTAESYDPDMGTPEHTTRAGSPSGGHRTAPKAPRAHDPARDLPENAPSPDRLTAWVAEMQTAIDPTIDWGATWSSVIEPVFQVKATADIPKPRQSEFWTRLVNALDRVAGANDLSSFPPLGQREEGVKAINEAIAWAFAGNVPTIVRRDPALDRPKEGTDDEAAATTD